MTIGGREFRFSAKIRRFSSTWSSSERSSSGVGIVFDSLFDDEKTQVAKVLKKKQERDAPMEPSGVIEKSSANTVLNFRDGVAELFGNGLALESLDGV